MRARRRAEDARAWVHSLVRSGLVAPEELYDQVVDALRADLRDGDAETTARAWVGEESAAWLAQASTWPETTDHDRLQQAFAALSAAGITVLQGCADHWAARDELARSEPTPRGIAWFTPSDVWHAVDEGMLEVNLWHGTTANAAPGDQLLQDVIAAFTTAGLEAHFDEGRIEVAAYWRRRPQ
jgi:hypothetical protein